jgi:hypothetical protein
MVFDLHRLPMVDALAPKAKRIALVRLDYLQRFNMCYLPIVINPLSIVDHACCRRAERWKQLLRSGLL